MLGFEFRDRMHGTWHRLEDAALERPIEYDVSVKVPALTQLLGDTVAAVAGRVRVEGLARDAEATGTLGLGAILRQGILPYRIAFVADDGRTYSLAGSKEMRLLDPARSFTTLAAYLFDDRGDEVGRAVLRFDLRSELVDFLKSWRPVAGGG